jgi:ABC-2 type transport system ATP-binding protein
MASNQEVVINAQGVYKNFKLPHEKTNSIKSLFTTIGRKRNDSIEVQHALRDVTFQVNQGDFFGIVGRNGSGKSTLLKLLAGIYQPTKGSIGVTGRLVPFIELGVGFNPELTGRENVYLSGALSGFSAKEVDEMYDDIVDFAELGQFMDQKLKNYSSGMQVRLAFSVATRAKADILLIDEVLAVGDADFQRKCFEYFKKLKKDKKTVVFVSHDMTAIREYCNKAVLVDKSRIIYSGTADEAAKEYTRMFLPDVYRAEQADQVKKSKKAVNKWGAGGVDIQNLHISKKVFDEKDDVITFSYDVIADEGFNDVIVTGILVKDARGEAVCGTNTEVLSQGKRKTVLWGGNSIHMTWTIPQSFNEGKYYIEPAILSGSTRDTLQWWDEAIAFRVVNPESVPYPIALKITFESTK